MFRYVDRKLYCDGVDLRVIAEQSGTPCYVYSAVHIRDAYREYDFALRELPHTICYAVKANSTLAILKVLADLGSGFDIVSGGELYRVLQAGGDPERVVFSGVGKTAREIAFALRTGINSFNCESESELELLNEIAGSLEMAARFSLRINPDVSAETHPYISTGLSEHKFGIEMNRAEKAYERSRRLVNLVPVGISCHIGSQMLDSGPVGEAATRVLELANRLRTRGIDLEHVDLGGGLGIAYHSGEQAPDIRTFIEGFRGPLRESGFTILLEPGRSIVGSAGVLLTQVLSRKKNGAKEFVIVDAAMNDLIRPALYQSHHEILPVDYSEETSLVDVVGPVCESGDFLARNRTISGAYPGDYLAVASAGAYGFSQSSNYNSRLRAAEVLVDQGQWRIVRERETYEDLVRGETV